MHGYQWCYKRIKILAGNRYTSEVYVIFLPQE
ncbi:hypothetical protein HCUR_00387 [Holospora curviuscula]|uniref:Uncharacterized protein n=1 Tax=Holospora curviuscula TaxID=1082868 RepID=A0A2S5RA40_9PROT|nr:hypothetical protein HCUR_00387 [Holospora curviuscula]